MAIGLELYERFRVQERAALYRKQDSQFAEWAAGYGVIRHQDITQVRVYEMADLLLQKGTVSDKSTVYRTLAAADRIASAAMWLVVHMTYARNVYLDNRELDGDDFKLDPQGHTGGSLNVVPAYTGYLAVDALTGITRSWLMGQGHCVSAIDACNLIVGNMTRAHADRYDLTNEGLTRFVRDFYSYGVRPDGYPESPVGSHVNVHTAGGMMEGGYLGFANLQYVHMPLPGERLVAFLSDGAAEEQRGGDWAPRWWRSEDCGLVMPILIANGRRIDQRTSMAMAGGTEWLQQYLELHRFEPITLDGRDPAAFTWAIFEMEGRLTANADAVASGETRYPLPLPFGIAETEKGYGFPGAGTNAAHGLPLVTNPAHDLEARNKFNTGAKPLWVPLSELKDAIAALNNHDQQGRVRERDHALARRTIPTPELPEPAWRDPSTGGSVSAMEGVDDYFCRVVQANPQLRPRVGNPDELRSNRMNATLDMLKHRVTDPEPGVAEAVNGAVITALNEEAVVSAALANKGGINIVVSYEAFAVKMLGAIRQELIFARHQREAGHDPQWLGVPIVLSSHVWENGKNEQSHQDPTLCEALMGEMTDVSRVLFPADCNSAAVTLQAAYRARGELWTMVVSKGSQPDRFSPAQTDELVRNGALRVRGDENARVQLVAIGSYQLTEALYASDRLGEQGIPHEVVYLLEPGRFRTPRDADEAAYTAPTEVRAQLFPTTVAGRVLLVHMRPEVVLGVVRPLDTGAGTTRALGYINRGGTLDAAGMLFANRCTWAHAVAAVAQVLELAPETLLNVDELEAIKGKGNAGAVILS
ncbi:MAG: xylulose 5-phosphate 3-epimerase [Acidiferrobacterales bacterium]